MLFHISNIIGCFYSILNFYSYKKAFSSWNCWILNVLQIIVWQYKLTITHPWSPTKTTKVRSSLWVLKGLSHKKLTTIFTEYCLKTVSWRIVRGPLKIIFVKGPVCKLHLNFSAFYKHLPLKMLNLSQVLSLAFSNFEIITFSQGCTLGKSMYYPPIWCAMHFERQIHVKNIISVCPTMYFQRVKHQWTHTWKKQCSHLNITQISPCKNLSKPRVPTQPDMAWYHFFEHFTWKVWCTA